jgi:hypothetical protein
LLRNVLAKVYGKDVVFAGPQPATLVVPPTDTSSVMIQLVNDRASNTLSFKPTRGCGGNTTPGKPCCEEMPFVLGTKSGHLVRAVKASLGAQLIVVSAPKLAAGDFITSVA